MKLRPVEEVFHSILEIAASAMHAETALVLLRTAHDYEVAASRTVAGQTRGLGDISLSLLNESISTNRALLTESAVEDPRFSGRSSVILQHIQSAVIVPLTGRAGVEGALLHGQPL